MIIVDRARAVALAAGPALPAGGSALIKGIFRGGSGAGLSDEQADRHHRDQRKNEKIGTSTTGRGTRTRTAQFRGCAGRRLLGLRELVVVPYGQPVTMRPPEITLPGASTRTNEEDCRHKLSGRDRSRCRGKHPCRVGLDDIQTDAHPEVTGVVYSLKEIVDAAKNCY